MRKLKLLKFVGFVFLASVFSAPYFVYAGPGLVTFQSRIIKPDGKPLEANSVNFRLSITDTIGSCVIYVEDFNGINMTDSKGLVTLSLGAGSKFFPSGLMPLTNVFNNYGAPLFQCQSGGSINAGPTDRRKLVMQFHDGTGWQTLPAMDINSNPFAMQASNALALGGHPASDYLRPSTITGCNPITQALTFNGSSFTCVNLSSAGGGTVTSVSSSNTDIVVSTGSSTPVLTLNVGTGPEQIVKLDPSGALPAVSGANVTNLNANSISSGTLSAARMPPLSGDVTTTTGTTVTAIANGVIDNDKVAASAGIARSKLATGTNNSIVINNSSGVMTDIACANDQTIKWAGGVPVCTNDLAGVGDIINGGQNGAVTIGTNDANSLVLETTGSSRLTVLSNGNIGIGTTSPAAPLHISNTATSTANFGTFSLGSSPFDGVTSGFFQGNSNGTVFAINAPTGFTGDLFNFQVGGVGRMSLSNRGELNVVTNMYGGQNAVSIGYGNTLDSNGALALGINNNATNNTNAVAIGRGNSATRLGMGVGNTSNSGGIAIGVNNNASNNSVAIGLDVINSTSGSLMIGPSNSAKMTILSNGNVGIGTTNPAGALDVQGGQSVTGNGTNITMTAQNGVGNPSWGGSIILTGGKGNSGMGFGASLSLGGSGWDGSPGIIDLYSGNGANGRGNGGRIQILSNVGQGGSGGSITLQASSSENGAHINILGGTGRTNGNGGSILLDGGVPTGSGVAGNILLGSSRGNVGIGNVTPADKLEVGGNIKANGQMIPKSQTITGGNSSLNWDNGNSIMTDYNCASNFSFANFRDGASYTLVVTDPGTTQCNFDTLTTGSDAANLTFRFKPANGARTASSYTVYSFLRVGSVVFVSWQSGF